MPPCALIKRARPKVDSYSEMFSKQASLTCDALSFFSMDSIESDYKLVISFLTQEA